LSSAVAAVVVTVVQAVAVIVSNESKKTFQIGTKVSKDGLRMVIGCDSVL
jgi:hypothetical protein